MRHYSLYVFRPDKPGGRPIDFDCETDDEAIEKALRLRDGQMSIELWQGLRLVKRSEAVRVADEPPRQHQRQNPS
jgi:hypothetical protein